MKLLGAADWRWWRTGLTATALALIAVAAQATVLTFDGLAAGGVVPADYGDRVTATTDSVTGWQYGLGNGFTPNVVVDYSSQIGEFSIWGAGYGDLTNVLGHYSSGLGEVVLTPDPGYSVVLHSFDVAPWSVGFPDSRVQVLNAAGDVLFDSGLFQVVLGTHNTFPSSPIVSTSALRIVNTTNAGALGFGYLGLDNVSLSQVPEPSVLGLLGCGVAGIAWARGSQLKARR
jgi:hypothetical protein